MKISKLKRISLLALGVILILAATLQVLALNTVQETEEDEDYTLVMDPGIGPQIPSPDMKRRVYRGTKSMGSWYKSGCYTCRRGR